MGDGVATMQSPSAQAYSGTPTRTAPGKPWAPPAVLDDNSSAFARYAASHKAFAGSNPPSRASSSTLSTQGQDSRKLSVTERMLSGQRLNSSRLKSQELPEFEPAEELAEDKEAPQGRRPATAAQLPDMPFQRTGSTASRAMSFDMGQRRASAQLSTKSARRASTSERMLSGQRLASQRMASQELPESDPSEELAEDDEPPPDQRRRSIGHPPTVPPASLHRPRWAQRQNQQAEKPRQLPHILSGIELQMNLELDNMEKEGFKPEEDSIAEDPLKPSPFDAAKLDPFSSESEDEAGLHRPGGVRTQRARSDADKALAHNRLDAQKGGGKDFEPSDSLAEDSEIPFDPAGHLATRQSITQKRPPKPVQKPQISAKRAPSMTDRMLVGQKLNSKELRDDDVRRPSTAKPASRASFELNRRPSSRQGSCKMSVTDRMLSGQLLHSQRLASQHLPNPEPSEELPDDYTPAPIAAA